MTWPGLGPSGYFWTLNTDGSIGRVDWEEARGDVSGVIDNLIVVALRGSPVSPTSPIPGDILEWDGAAWTPTSTVGVSGVGNHNLLSSVHLDTVPATVNQGDLVAGSGAPASWVRFPIGDPGQRLTASNSGTLGWAEPNVIEPSIVASGTITNLDDGSRRIIVNKAVGSPTTVNLPSSPVLGQEIVIKDGKGDAGAPDNNIITIVPPFGTFIDGLSGVVIAQNYGAYTVYWNGTEWNII